MTREFKDILNDSNEENLTEAEELNLGDLILDKKEWIRFGPISRALGMKNVKNATFWDGINGKIVMVGDPNTSKNLRLTPKQLKEILKVARWIDISSIGW